MPNYENLGYNFENKYILICDFNNIQDFLKNDILFFKFLNDIKNKKVSERLSRQRH